MSTWSTGTTRRYDKRQAKATEALKNDCGPVGDRELVGAGGAASPLLEVAEPSLDARQAAECSGVRCRTTPGMSACNVVRYTCGVIRSFRDSATERLWSRQRVKSIDPRIERVALRKLVMLDAAETLEDLRIPPGNRLEALRGDRSGQNSIRINQQWRICFTWTDAGPTDVEIVDYH